MDCCILAMVGDGMIERLGIAGKFFTALGKAEVNIRAMPRDRGAQHSVVIEQRSDQGSCPFRVLSLEPDTFNWSDWNRANRRHVS